MSSFIDLARKQFSRLLVLQRSPMQHKSGALWICRCSCGTTIVVRGNDLRHNKTKSCGCLRRDQSKNNVKIAHKSRIKHGLSNSPEYRSWLQMIHRCTNPKHISYQHYGKCGIGICDRWKLVTNFVTDMGLRPAGTTLHRINPRGNYEPTNCIWASASLQQHGKLKLVPKTSQYKGVCRKAKESKWQANIYVNNRGFYLGAFDTEKEAALTYDQAARRIHGQNAILNFPLDPNMRKAMEIVTFDIPNQEKIQ